MSWNEKATEIAETILEKMEDGVVNSYTRDDVLNGLKEAALKGIQYECDCWVTRKI